jgi:hypothetical protein
VSTLRPAAGLFALADLAELMSAIQIEREEPPAIGRLLGAVLALAVGHGAMAA